MLIKLNKMQRSVIAIKSNKVKISPFGFQKKFLKMMTTGSQILYFSFYKFMYTSPYITNFPLLHI